jgi:hypothetical protein
MKRNVKDSHYSRIRIEDIQQVRNRWAIYENVAKKDHNVNPYLESAEMDVKECD